jgi:hypothetical protein
MCVHRVELRDNLYLRIQQLLTRILMRIRILYPIAVCLLIGFCFSLPAHAQPIDLGSRGIGGGGGLFSPSFNPFSGDEYYLASDLGGLFFTKNRGLRYDVLPFRYGTTGVLGRVAFADQGEVRYTILWDRERFASRPVKSVDGGTSWSFIPGDASPGESELFLHADPFDGDRVAWSEYNTLYYSGDGGTSSKVVLSASDPGVGVLFSGAFFHDNNIYLGTNEGILLSEDNGDQFALASWDGIPAGEAIVGFAGGKRDSTVRLYALTADAGSIWATNPANFYWNTFRGVYAKAPGDAFWTSVMNGLEVDRDFVGYLAMAVDEPDVCYLAGADPTGRAVVLKTEDGGGTWLHVFLRENNQNIHTGYMGHGGDLSYYWGGQALGFGVNPLNADQALVTDFGFVHRTDDGAANWHQAYLDPADENPAGQPTPKGKTYRGVGLEQTSVWQVYWFDEETMFGCFTDIGGVRSEDGGETWSFDYTGHELNTMYRIAKHRTEDIWYGATSSVHDIYRTTYVTDARLQPGFKAGLVLFTRNKGKDWEEMRDFGNPVIWVETDPSDPDRLYAGVVSTESGVGGVWRADGISDPANAQWTKLPDPPANRGRIFNIVVLDDGTLVTSWSARKHDTESIFSDSSGVFVSLDGGMSWEDRSHPDMKYWTKDVVVDPYDEDQNTWYACVWSGWGGPANDLGRLFRTRDRGMSWEPITAPRQFHRVSSVTTDTQSPSALLLTTEDQGLWITSDKDSDNPRWEPYIIYPFHSPERVFFNTFRTLDRYEMWVASFGYGMYQVFKSPISTKRFDQTPFLSVKITPNPVGDELSWDIEGLATGVYRWSVVDMSGAERLSGIGMGGHGNEAKGSVDAGVLPAGVYAVVIDGGSGMRGRVVFVKEGDRR